MTQYKVICLFVAIAGGLCLATAQSSQVGSSSAKRGADPLQTATKPLTPKSAMPPQRKSPVVAPKASAGSRTHSPGAAEHQSAQREDQQCGEGRLGTEVR
jgi:hypothetical protein